MTAASTLHGLARDAGERAEGETRNHRVRPGLTCFILGRLLGCRDPITALKQTDRTVCVELHALKMSESPVESQADVPVRVLLVGAQHPAARPLAEALAKAAGCAAVRVTESAPQDWLR